MSDIRNYFKAKPAGKDSKPNRVGAKHQSKNDVSTPIIDISTPKNDNSVPKNDNSMPKNDKIHPKNDKTVKNNNSMTKLKKKLEDTRYAPLSDEDDDEEIIVPKKKLKRVVIQDDDEDDDEVIIQKKKKKSFVEEEKVQKEKKNIVSPEPKRKAKDKADNKIEDDKKSVSPSKRKSFSKIEEKKEEKKISPSKKKLLEKEEIKTDLKEEKKKLDQAESKTKFDQNGSKKSPVKSKHFEKNQENGNIQEKRTSPRKKVDQDKITKSHDDKIISGIKKLSIPKVQYEQMWVDKHKPVSSSQIIGQQGDKSCVKKLAHWLQNWHKNYDKKPGFGKFASDDGSGFKAALLSGPPGIGKTTSAQLVCKELGLSFVELNASDTRNKKSLQEEVHELLHNKTLANFGANKSPKNQMSDKHVLIMDEVDGMSGNEDRGGVQELIQLIKKTRVPLICICNDRSHPKMRSLVNYCYDLRFYKPRVEQIKAAMMSIAFKEKIQIAPDALQDLIASSNQDIRQILHSLSLLSAGTGQSRINKLINEKSMKDVRIGPFDALRKVFSSGVDYARMSFQDKADLFFSDYSIMPLFVFENYLTVNPNSARGNETKKLKLISKTIDAIAYGGLIEKEIRTNNNWSLLPLQAAFSTVMPGAYMNGHLGAQIQFPSLLGRMSTCNKRERLLQELKMHMNLKISGSKTSLNLDYLEPLRNSLVNPLIKEGAEGIPKVLERLESYYLKKEDIETMNELTLWENQTDPMKKVDSKVKAALTRAYNKESFTLPYSLGTVKKGRSQAADNIDDYEGLLNEEGETQDDDDQGNNNEDDIDLDAMIKKKPGKKQSNKKLQKQESDDETGDNKTSKSKGKASKPRAKKSPKKQTNKKGGK